MPDSVKKRRGSDEQRPSRYDCPRRLLAFSHLRSQLDRAASRGETCIASYPRRLDFDNLESASVRCRRPAFERSMARLATREAVEAALAILRERGRRRVNACIARQPMRTPVDRLRDQLRREREPIVESLAMAVAAIVNDIAPKALMQSKRAEIVYGRSDHEAKEWCYAGSHKNYPAKWKNAGVTVEWDDGLPISVTVWSSRGDTYTYAITASAWRMAKRGNVDAAARKVCGVVSVTAETVGNVREREDGRPWHYPLVHDARRVRDRAARGMIVRQDMRDIAATYLIAPLDGRDHMFSIPRRFAEPLGRGERVGDRVLAALHYKARMRIAGAA